MNQYLSLQEAGKALGVRAYRIAYAITTGQVREPCRIFGKRAFRRSDLTALAKHFGVQLTTPAPVPDKEEHA